MFELARKWFWKSQHVALQTQLYLIACFLEPWLSSLSDIKNVWTGFLGGYLQTKSRDWKHNVFARGDTHFHKSARGWAGLYWWDTMLQRVSLDCLFLLDSVPDGGAERALVCDKQGTRNSLQELSGTKITNVNRRRRSGSSPTSGCKRCWLNASQKITILTFLQKW